MISRATLNSNVVTNSRPRPLHGFGTAVLALVLFATVSSSFIAARAQNNNEESGARGKNEGGSGLVARGAYLVNSVAVCSQCHTPRDSNGAFDTSRWLQGAPLWIMPAHTWTNWPFEAPRIAGNPPASDAEMIKLLTTGIWKDGTRLRLPMPQFRFSEQDAQAVVAYLKSLNMNSQ